MGAGSTIITVSLFLKGLFLYPTLMAQVNRIKMQGLKKDLDNFKGKDASCAKDQEQRFNVVC